MKNISFTIRNIKEYIWMNIRNWMITKGHKRKHENMEEWVGEEGLTSLTMALHGCIFMPLQPFPSLVKDYNQLPNLVLHSNKQLQKLKVKNISCCSPSARKTTMASLLSFDSRNHFTIGVTPGARPEHLVVLVNGIIGR